MSANRMTTDEWYREAFDAQYLEVYPWRDEASAEAEVSSAIDWLQGQEGDRWLDLCCGAGRHSHWLQQAGFDLVSLDLSGDLLAEARRRLGPEAVLVQSDVRSMPLEAASFDHVVMFFTSFGYFPTDEENRAVLKEIARVVRPGGGFLLDLPDRESVISGLIPTSQRNQGNLHIDETRSISGDGKRVEKKVVLSRDGNVRSYTESVRLFGIDEIENMLEATGWISDQVHGNWVGDPYRSGKSQRMIVLAHRVEGDR